MHTRLPVYRGPHSHAFALLGLSWSRQRLGLISAECQNRPQCGKEEETEYLRSTQQCLLRVAMGILKKQRPRFPHGEQVFVLKKYI